MIQPNPLQPRAPIVPDTLLELVRSIEVHGILEPLVVNDTPAGYQIVAGERRWRAAKLAGLDEVPVILKKTSPKNMLELAVVENIQRTGLNPIDRAKAYERLAVDFRLSHDQIAERVGKTKSHVSNTLKLLGLPDLIKDALINRVISEAHGRLLVGLGDPKRMIEVFKQVVEESATVRRTQDIITALKSRLEAEVTESIAVSQAISRGETYRKPKKSPRSNVIDLDLLDKMKTSLEKSLGEKSEVTFRQSKKSAALNIRFTGTPEETQRKIQQIYAILSQSEIAS